MRKNFFKSSMMSLLALSCTATFVFAESTTGGVPPVYYPSAEEIAAQQPAVYNPETDQFGIPQALGDAMADLVYTPVTPCRLVDTRIATDPNFTGPIAAGTTLAIDTDGGGGLTAQGGNSSGCGTYGNVAAIAVTITAVNPTGNGHFQAFAHGGSLPNASILNYRTGANIANTTIVPQDTSINLAEMDLFVSNTTDVVVDVVGYFDPPATTTPTQYVTDSGYYSIPANSNYNQYAPPCPTGYRLTGGGWGRASFAVDVQVATSRPANGTNFSIVSGTNVADRWLCQWRNNEATSQSVWCQSICTRIP